MSPGSCRSATMKKNPISLSRMLFVDINPPIKEIVCWFILIFKIPETDRTLDRESNQVSHPQNRV